MESEKATTAHLLHLSDLHITSTEDTETWCGQLAEDLKIELGCHRLDALILSGDIADKSLPEEYEAASRFLDDAGTSISRLLRLLLFPGTTI